MASIRVTAVRMPGVLGYASNINASDLYKYTNEQRKLKGLSELNLDPDLTKAASAKAEDMFKNNYWAHVSPSGIEPWYFFSEVNYDYSTAGENLAKNFNESKSVVKAWMDSPTHRDNLLNPNYNDIGFAVVNGTLDGYQTTLVVQFFGKRRTPVPVEKVEIGGLKVQRSDSSLLESQIGEKLSAVDTSKKEEFPLIDIYFFTKTISLILAGFVFALFMIDFWYSSRKGIVKLNGHTLAHIFLLMLAIVSIGFVIVPGRVL